VWGENTSDAEWSPGHQPRKSFDLADTGGVATVASLGLKLPVAAVPLTTRASSSAGMASPRPWTRANRIAALSQAALIQLAGITWLYFVDQPIAVLGWAPIAMGFVLYIRARRRPIAPKPRLDRRRAGKQGNDGPRTCHRGRSGGIRFG
jgi:hypothetical protein